ncbi:MAG: hypothetical protein ACR2P8_05395 [Myxococcota bacterium]
MASVLASVDPEAFVGSKADRFALEQILIERFLYFREAGFVDVAVHDFVPGILVRVSGRKRG